MNQDNKQHPITNEPSDLRLEIALGGSYRFTKGDPIMLKVWVTNISSNTAKVIETHILRDYVIKVMFENGQPVSMTSVGQQLEKSVSDSQTFTRMEVELKPGELHQVGSPVRLDEWFQLDRSDAYIVQVQQKNEQKRPYLLISNLIFFEIVDREDERL